jgi:hypothetical protein
LKNPSAKKAEGFFIDVGSILPETRMSDFPILQDAFLFLFPAIDLFYAAPGILVQGNVEFSDEPGVFCLDVKGVVFRIMLAGFRAVKAKTPWEYAWVAFDGSDSPEIIRKAGLPDRYVKAVRNKKAFQENILKLIAVYTYLTFMP